MRTARAIERRGSSVTFGKNMKPVAALLLFWCVPFAAAQSDVYFLPCEAKASVSFAGVTQAGRDVHRLEVRRLAYLALPAKKEYVSGKSCVVYFAGDEYGPSLLRTMNDCMDPLVRQVSVDVVEVFFLAGAHTHIRQRWRLLGHTAKLEDEREIDWRDDPRMKEEPNQTPEPTPTAGTSAAEQPLVPAAVVAHL